MDESLPSLRFFDIAENVDLDVAHVNGQ